MSIPNSFLCPISQQIMEDPYIDTDGNSYERSAIMEWLGTRQISPITRRPLYPTNLVPNRGLKTLIEEYRNNGSLPEETSTVEDESTAPLDRKPLMLFAIIDNSGSMGDPCNERVVTEEDDGFSRLDLVKHTMNTIITSLSCQDKICLIKFSNVAQIIAELTSLTSINKKKLLDIMNNLVPEYSTNIWDGLRMALDIISQLSRDIIHTYNIEIFLLTDGVPNINPPRPITDTLQTYLTKKCENITLKLHTFGYGYNLISKTLYDLATIGKGCFGFIPDASMVGTVFINSISNTLVDTEFIVSNTTTSNTSSTSSIQNICMRFSEVLHSILNETVTSRQYEELNNFILYLQEQLNILHTTTSTTTSTTSDGIDFIESLLLDCQHSQDPNLGQIYKAIQIEYYLKWGKHYLYSVLSAYENYKCINFKDKGMQIFKSERFKLEQERIEDIFVQLPAPVPSASNHQQYNGYYNPSHHTPQAYAMTSSNRGPMKPAVRSVNMNNYHNAGGGCFTADSLVFVSHTITTATLTPSTNTSTTNTNSTTTIRCVRDIQPGMFVLTNIGISKVECVVKLKYNGPLYQVETMKLTPYHPIMRGDSAYFPINCSSKNDQTVEQLDAYVYDFVLENRGLIAFPSINTASTTSNASTTTASSHKEENEVLYAATYGHHETKGCFSHAYFGSDAIVRDLRKHPDYLSGTITLDKYVFIREKEGEFRVIGLSFEGTSTLHSESDLWPSPAGSLICV